MALLNPLQLQYTCVFACPCSGPVVTVTLLMSLNNNGLHISEILYEEQTEKHLLVEVVVIHQTEGSVRCDCCACGQKLLHCLTDTTPAVSRMFYTITIHTPKLNTWVYMTSLQPG